MIRILLYQPPYYRDMLTFFLNNMEGFQIVGSWNTHVSVEKQIYEMQPHIVLLDTTLPQAMPLLGRIKKCDPSVKVIVLTDQSEIPEVITCLRNGADGYLLIKKTPLPALADCIKVAREGGFPMSPSLMGHVLRQLMPEPSIADGDYTTSKLTKRENEILRLLVNGFTYKAISSHLHIALDTVRSHIKNIYEKLNVSSKSEAVVKALRENMTMMLM